MSVLFETLTPARPEEEDRTAFTSPSKTQSGVEIKGLGVFLIVVGPLGPFDVVVLNSVPHIGPSYPVTRTRCLCKNSLTSCDGVSKGATATIRAPPE